MTHQHYLLADNKWTVVYILPMLAHTMWTVKRERKKTGINSLSENMYSQFTKTKINFCDISNIEDKCTQRMYDQLKKQCKLIKIVNSTLQ